MKNKETVIKTYLALCLICILSIAIYYSDTIIEAFMFAIIIMASILLAYPNDIKSLGEELVLISEYFYNAIMLRIYFVFIFFGSIVGIVIAIKEDSIGAMLAYLFLIIISGIVNTCFIIIWNRKRKK